MNCEGTSLFLILAILLLVISPLGLFNSMPSLQVSGQVYPSINGSKSGNLSGLVSSITNQSNTTSSGSSSLNAQFNVTSILGIGNIAGQKHAKLETPSNNLQQHDIPNGFTNKLINQTENLAAESPKNEKRDAQEATCIPDHDNITSCKSGEKEQSVTPMIVEPTINQDKVGVDKMPNDIIIDSKLHSEKNESQFIGNDTEKNNSGNVVINNTGATVPKHEVKDRNVSKESIRPPVAKIRFFAYYNSHYFSDIGLGSPDAYSDGRYWGGLNSECIFAACHIAYLEPGRTYGLTGRESSDPDPDGHISSYEWKDPLSTNANCKWVTGFTGPVHVTRELDLTTPRDMPRSNCVFTVELKVTDNTGLSDTDSIELSVFRSPPPPGFGVEKLLFTSCVIIFGYPPHCSLPAAETGDHVIVTANDGCAAIQSAWVEDGIIKFSALPPFTRSAGTAGAPTYEFDPDCTLHGPVSVLLYR